MLARSFAPNFWAPLDAAHRHDNHLLTSPALKCVLAPDQSNDKRNTTSSRRGDDNDASTCGIVDATTGATSRRCHVRDEDGDARPTSTVALATTPHDTKREVKGGGRRTSGETSGRRSSGRACTRARGPREYVRFSSALKQICCLPPALNRAKAQHACVLRPPERGGAGCQSLIKTPMTGTPSSTWAEAPYA